MVDYNFFQYILDAFGALAHCFSKQRQARGFLVAEWRLGGWVDGI